MKKLSIIICLLIISLLCGNGFSTSQRDSFVFGQITYDGQWDPYPETWQDILQFIATATSIRTGSQRRTLSLDDDAVYETPFIVLLGNGTLPPLNARQRERLRRYLSNGGLLFAEDSTGMRGSSFDVAFRSEMERLFPEYRLTRLKSDHPLFKAYYLLRGVGGRRLTNTYLEGIDIAGRTAVIYSQNDVIGAWAKDRFGNFLWECTPGGQSQRFEAQKLMLNIIMYSVTGTYKSDAIHQPYINRKLGR
jgi:hypothetical protein